MSSGVIDLATTPKNNYSRIKFEPLKAKNFRAATQSALVQESRFPIQKLIENKRESFTDEHTSIGKIGLEEFVEKFEDYRNSLAEKKLDGKRLNVIEVWHLRILNNRLDDLLATTPPREHIDALEALKEAKRFLAKVKR